MFEFSIAMAWVFCAAVFGNVGILMDRIDEDIEALRDSLKQQGVSLQEFLAELVFMSALCHQMQVKLKELSNRESQ